MIFPHWTLYYGLKYNKLRILAKLVLNRLVLLGMKMMGCLLDILLLNIPSMTVERMILALIVKIDMIQDVGLGLC